MGCCKWPPGGNFCCASSQCCLWAPGATTARPSLRGSSSAVTLYWGSQHVPECTGSEGFYMVLPTATHYITAHIHVHTFDHLSRIHLAKFGQICRIRTRPGRIQARLRLASRAEQGPWKGMPCDAMRCDMALGHWARCLESSFSSEL